MNITLRIITFDDVLNDRDILDCDAVFNGTLHACIEYAEDNGYTWKNARKYIYGGYWYKKGGDCLIPT